MSCLSCFRAIKSPVFPTWQPEMCVGILRINLHNLATENRHNHFIQVHVQVNIFDQFYTLKDPKRLGQNFYFIFWVAFRQKCIKLIFFFRFILFLWLSSGKRDDAYFEDSTQNPCHTPNLSIILSVSVCEKLSAEKWNFSTFCHYILGIVIINAVGTLYLPSFIQPRTAGKHSVFLEKSRKLIYFSRWISWKTCCFLPEKAGKLSVKNSKNPAENICLPFGYVRSHI